MLVSKSRRQRPERSFCKKQAGKQRGKAKGLRDGQIRKGEGLAKQHGWENSLLGRCKHH